MSQKKLEDSEYSKLRALNSSHGINVTELAKNEVSISRLKKKKETLIDRFETSESNVIHFNAELGDKYGKGMKVDFTTGNIYFPK